MSKKSTYGVSLIARNNQTVDTNEDLTILENESLEKDILFIRWRLFI